MEIPKNIVKEKAIEQLSGKIELESATWAGRLAEKVEAEKKLVGGPFSEDQIKNYEKTASFLNGKDQKHYMQSFSKLSVAEREDYSAILEYKTAENRVNNAIVQMETALARVNACTEVKELIESSMTDKDKK
jgi:hypothetical protein